MSGDTRSTSAVSSTVSPAKNRSSITFAFRGSIVASAVSASSKRITSRARRSHVWRLVQVELHSFPAALGSNSPPCPIQQNVPHNLCRHSKEMSSMLPVDVVDINQLQVGLVNQRGRLKRASAPFVAHKMRCQAMKFVVDARRQPGQRFPVATRPGAKKLVVSEQSTIQFSRTRPVVNLPLYWLGGQQIPA